MHLRRCIYKKTGYEKGVMMRSNSDSNCMLLDHLDKLHTTDMGVERIKRNLSLEIDDVVDWCKEYIKSSTSLITRKGKNWYIQTDKCIITVNAYSYTIITAHKSKAIN